MWVTTNAGLTRFTPQTETFVTFGPDDGVQGLRYNEGTSHRGPGGTLYFGGENGLNRLDPSSGRLPPPARWRPS